MLRVVISSSWTFVWAIPNRLLSVCAWSIKIVKLICQTYLAWLTNQCSHDHVRVPLVLILSFLSNSTLDSMKILDSYSTTGNYSHLMWFTWIHSLHAEYWLTKSRLIHFVLYYQSSPFQELPCYPVVFIITWMTPLRVIWWRKTLLSNWWFHDLAVLLYSPHHFIIEK